MTCKFCVILKIDLFMKNRITYIILFLFAFIFISSLLLFFLKDTAQNLDMKWLRLHIFYCFLILGKTILGSLAGRYSTKR